MAVDEEDVGVLATVFVFRDGLPTGLTPLPLIGLALAPTVACSLGGHSQTPLTTRPLMGKRLGYTRACAKTIRMDHQRSLSGDEK